MQSMQERLEVLHISSEWVRAAGPPGAHPKSSLWLVTLRRVERARESTMEVVMHLGPGFGGIPAGTALVLETLASDAYSYEETASYEEWCAELGYEQDDAGAPERYARVQEQSEQLRAFLGHHYDTIVYGDEAEEDEEG